MSVVAIGGQARTGRAVEGQLFTRLIAMFMGIENKIHILADQEIEQIVTGAVRTT
jgi:hypothetical protein